MCLLGKYWTVAQRNAEQAREWALRSEWFRTDSMSEPHPCTSDAPSDEPQDSEDPPALPPHLDRSWGKIARNFGGNPAGKRQRDRFQDEMREQDLRGLAVGNP